MRLTKTPESRLPAVPQTQPPVSPITPHGYISLIGPAPSRRAIQVRLPRFSIWSRTLFATQLHSYCLALLFSLFGILSVPERPLRLRPRRGFQFGLQFLSYHCTISNALYTYHTPNNYHRLSEPPSVLCTIAGTIWHM